MKEPLGRLDVWCKMALMALFVLLYAMTRSYPSESRQFPQLMWLVLLSTIPVSLTQEMMADSPNRKRHRIQSTS